MRRERSFRRSAKDSLDASIQAGFSMARRCQGGESTYERLLKQVQARTRLLKPSGRPGDNRSSQNAALYTMAMHFADWLRPIETWNPPPQTGWPQFTSLAHHLFARYPVPAFMTTAWFETPPAAVLPQHGWYKHLGKGGSIRSLNLPIRLTRKMAHLFSQAPHHFTAIKGLRWAQVRGLGGREELARAVAATRLGRILENEGFWESVLQFVISQRCLELAQVGPIVDFLQHQKFTTNEGITLDGEFGTLPPPQPDYSMKGRTVSSIMRHVEEWHRQLGQELHQPNVAWRHSPINDFQWIDEEEPDDVRVWTITELLTNRALFIEGQNMHHCVATYGEDCIRRWSSIWSMQVESKNGRRRVLTIEVMANNNTIIQARRRFNDLPRAEERKVMRMWTEKERLRIDEWL